MQKLIIKALLLISVLILPVLFVYHPGLSGPMVGDDFPNIVNNANIQMQATNLDSMKRALLSNDSGLLKRPIAALSFTLNYLASGMKIDAHDFKQTNVAIHAANGVLFFLVSIVLIGVVNRGREQPIPPVPFAILAALLWVMHPIQLTAVLYTVQRMTSLSACFLLMGYLVFLSGRVALTDKRRYAIAQMVVGVMGGVVLSVFSKENGILLPLFALVSELTVFNSSTMRPESIKKLLVQFYGVFVLVPMLLMTAYVLFRPEFIMAGYAQRNFTLLERLMTEHRVLFYYAKLIFLPSNADYGLFHDDFEISHQLLHPWTTLISIVGLYTTLIVALFVRKDFRVFSFAILWFLAGHVLESTFIALELVFEHRNYVPSMGAALGIAYLISVVANGTRQYRVHVYALGAVFVFCLSILTYIRAEIWSGPETLTHFELRNHPNSVRAHATYAKILESQGALLPEIYEQYRIAAQLDTAEVVSPVYMYHLVTILKLALVQNKTEASVSGLLPERYDAPLVLRPDYIAKLEALLNREIETRLLARSGILRTVPTLNNMRNCVLSSFQPCIDSSDVFLNWMQIFLKNPYLDNASKAAAYLNIAKILAYRGDVNAAAMYVEKAYNVSRCEKIYLFEKFFLFVDSGAYYKAEELLKDIHKIRVASPIYDAEISILENYLSKAKVREKAEIQGAVVNAN